MAGLFEEMTEYWLYFWGMPYSLPEFYHVLWPYAFALQFGAFVLYSMILLIIISSSSIIMPVYPSTF